MMIFQKSMILMTVINAAKAGSVLRGNTKAAVDASDHENQQHRQLVTSLEGKVPVQDTSDNESPSPKRMQQKPTDCNENAAIITNDDVVVSYGAKTPFPDNALSLISSDGDNLEVMLKNVWEEGVVYFSWRSEDSVGQYQCLEEGLNAGEFATREALCVYGVAEVQVFVHFMAGGGDIYSNCQHRNTDRTMGFSYTFELPCDPLCVTSQLVPEIK